jgi:uncharacterized protein YkwD
MAKGLKRLILVAAMLFAAGANHKVQAETTSLPTTFYASTYNALSEKSFDELPTLWLDMQGLTSCSTSQVSTPLCNEIEEQACAVIATLPDQPRQIQAAVIIAEANSEEPLQTSIAVEPEVLPTMTPLIDKYASEGAVLDSDRIFDLINQYRQSRGLPVFEKDDKVCELAQIRSGELVVEVANGTIHSGLYGRNLPYWIWENAKVGSNEEGTVAWWLASALHHQSIVGDYKFSCVKCTGNACSELFTSFSPK